MSRLGHRNHRVYEDVCLPLAKSGREALLGLPATASYSMANGTLNNKVPRPWRMDRSKAAEAPAGLRIAATTAARGVPGS